MKPSKALFRIALCFIAIAAFSLTASAQDAQQVLRLWVQYNSVKNASISSMDDAKKAEVARLDSAAQAANAAHNYGEAMKDYFHALVVMRGMEWTPSRALGFGLKVTVDRSVVEPESKIELRIGQIFKLDVLPASISCTVDLVAGTAAKGTTRIATLAAIGPDLDSHPSISMVAIPLETSGNYQLHLTLSPAGGDPVSKDTNIFVEKGLPARATRDISVAVDIESKVKKSGDLALLGSLFSAEYRLALYDLANSGKMDP